MPEPRPSRCAVCGKPANKIACSSLEATTHAYCDDCLGKDVEPYAETVIHTAIDFGKFPEDASEEFCQRIRRMLPVWEKTEEQFIRDVEAAIKDLTTCDFQASEPCDTCKHYLGGGQCRINLERECAEGEYEAWERAPSDEEPIVIDLREVDA